MKRAVDLALENVSEAGQSFGAVLAKDGEFIAKQERERLNSFSLGMKQRLRIGMVNESRLKKLYFFHINGF